MDSEIIKECGFSAIILRPTAEIKIESIKFVEPEMVYGEKNIGINSLDYELLPSQRSDFNAEYNSISSKVAKEWRLKMDIQSMIFSETFSVFLFSIKVFRKFSGFFWIFLEKFFRCFLLP